MIIDAHTHAFPEKIAAKTIAALQAKASSRAYTDGTEHALSVCMQQANIDMGILLPVMTNPAQVEKLNTQAIQKNNNTAQTRIFSLGGMHPDYENYAAELTRIAREGITGIKLHPAYQGVDLADIRYLRIIDKAAQLGLAVVIHAGWDIGIMHHNFSSVAHIQSVLKTLQPPKLVLAHMGGWKDWDKVEKELCGEHVYFDTSFSLGQYTPPSGITVPDEKRQLLTQEQFIRIIRKHGAHQVLFGTDSPWSEQTQSLNALKACSFTQEQLNLILSANAKTVFSLPACVCSQTATGCYT